MQPPRPRRSPSSQGHNSAHRPPPQSVASPRPRRVPDRGVCGALRAPGSPRARLPPRRRGRCGSPRAPRPLPAHVTRGALWPRPGHAPAVGSLRALPARLPPPPRLPLTGGNPFPTPHRETDSPEDRRRLAPRTLIKVWPEAAGLQSAGSRAPAVPPGAEDQPPAFTPLSHNPQTQGSTSVCPALC